MLVTHLVADAKSSGSLPTWRKERFGDVCSIYRGGSPRPIQHYITTHSDGINWIKIGDVGIGAKYIDSTEEKITQAGATRSRSVRRGDFLLSNSMSFGRPYILRTDGCIHDGWLTIQDYKRDFETDFLYYYLSSEEVASQYRRYAAGSGVQNLNKEVVSNIDVFIPPIPEQRAIAEALGDVDELIGSLERLITKKRDIKQAVMQQLLTGKTRLPGYSKEWRHVKLGSLGQFLKGSGISRSQAQSGSIPCVRYGELYTVHHNVIQTFESFISREVANTALRLRKGDILFAGSGETKEEIGKCASFVDDLEAYAGGDIVVFRSQVECAQYLGYYLNAPIIANQKASKGQGDAVVHISAKGLADIDCHIPEVHEQEAIAEVIASIDLEIAHLNKRLAKTRDIKQGMMQHLLTGKVRLV